MGDVEEAVNIIRSTGNNKLFLLQCTSHYPSEAKDSNLRVMQTLKQSFQLPVGYSDHTKGIIISLAAVAMGACIIEKHFTFDTSSWGVDHDASINSDELKELVKNIKIVEDSFGDPIKKILEIEKEIVNVHTVSIVSRVDIPKGTKITKDMLVIKKPGIGIRSKHIDLVVGRVANVDIEADRLIKWEYI